MQFDKILTPEKYVLTHPKWISTKKYNGDISVFKFKIENKEWPKNGTKCNPHQKKLIDHLINRCVNVFDLQPDSIETNEHHIRITIYKKSHRSITVESSFYGNTKNGISLDIRFHNCIDGEYINVASLLYFVYNKIEINAAIKAYEYIVSTTPVIYDGV